MTRLEAKYGAQAKIARTIERIQTAMKFPIEKLWQGCGKNSDFAAKTDIIDNFLLNEISNLRVCNALRLHPAYKLIRHFSISYRQFCATSPIYLTQIHFSRITRRPGSTLPSGNCRDGSCGGDAGDGHRHRRLALRLSRQERANFSKG